MMPTTFVTADQDAIVSEIHIAAPAERVFQALTDPQQLIRWWNSEECTTEFFEMDTRPGGHWRFGTKKTKLNVNGVNQFFCQGEVLEYDPPRLLAYTWIANWHDDKSRRTVVPQTQSCFRRAYGDSKYSSRSRHSSGRDIHRSTARAGVSGDHRSRADG